jgi:very-short-patch-repair endonuclease
MERRERIRGFAKQQRGQMTRAEKDVWRELRAARFYGKKFKRQAPIGSYIVDFVCSDAALIIELDGEPHETPEQKRHDHTRDDWLRSQGFRVLRFSNDRFFGNPGIVMEEIARALEAPSLGSGLAARVRSLPQGERGS